MGLHRKFIAALLVSVFAVPAFAQSKQYQQRKEAPAPAPAAPAPAAKGGKDAKLTPAPAADPAKPESDKLDISELEQKYWAPKDTDFSVVQNRTYTKENRFALTLGYGPVVNDTFSEGMNTQVALNYYFSERTGLELQYISSDLENSDSTEKFKKLSGGGTSPDFNRATEFIGIGYNFVPFYAKMSFMGKKIIYFDMQITPIIGQAKYEQQQNGTNGHEKTAMAYGLDITQYFFFDKNFAVRLNLHNRWSEQKEISFINGRDMGKDNDNTTMFLFGLTWFMN